MSTRRGVLAQQATLGFPFAVAETVRIGIAAKGGLPVDRVSRNHRVSEASTAVDLAGFAGRFYLELSGGECQRVQLARGSLPDPGVCGRRRTALAVSG